MKHMKTILLLVTIMFLSHSCAKPDMEMEQKKRFATANKMFAGEFPGEISSVYFQSWMAGVRGGGSGTDFYIELAQPLPERVILSQVYFRGKKESVTMINKYLYEVSFRNDENNGNVDIFVSKTKKGTSINSVHSLLLDDTQAELVYYENDVLKLYVLSDVKEIEPLMYP